MAAVLNSPEIQKVWAAQGAEVPNVPAANVEEYVRAEIQRWTTATRDANIKLD